MSDIPKNFDTSKLSSAHTDSVDIDERSTWWREHILRLLEADLGAKREFVIPHDDPRILASILLNL